MQILRTVQEMRDFVAAAGRPVVVPTMGNLHAGHIALVRRAVELAQTRPGAGGQAAPVISTIFVNRLQFAPHEDFDTYPRTFDADAAGLKQAGCTAVFAPTEKELYPEPQGFKVHAPSELDAILEGHFRPGFFTGVCTVVLKLFSTTEAQAAVFGKKDYQQQMIIKRMVAQFNLPVHIESLATERAEDGLALSSRNGYLSTEERSRAIQLYSSLKDLSERFKAARQQLSSHEQLSDWVSSAEDAAMKTLQSQGWQPDYIALRQQRDLQPLHRADEAAVVLAAARLGSTRLIDNLEI